MEYKMTSITSITNIIDQNDDHIKKDASLSNLLSTAYITDAVIRAMPSDLLYLVRKDMEMDKDIYNFFGKMNFNTYEEMLFNLTGQQFFKEKKYSTYKFDRAEYRFSFVTDIDNMIYNTFPFQIQLLQDNFIFSMLNPETLKQYVDSQNPLDLFRVDPESLLKAPPSGHVDSNLKNKKTYVVLPLNYYDGKGGHIALLVFDNNKNVYLVDPNGRPQFFNNSTGNDTGEDNASESQCAIEISLSTYFNKCGYNYVLTNKWCKPSDHNQLEPGSCTIGPLNIGNHSYNMRDYDQGNCLPYTLLLAHILSNNTGTDEVGEVYDRLYKIDNFTRRELIYNYQANLYKQFILSL
jgi:hypothetical protein